MDKGFVYRTLQWRIIRLGGKNMALNIFEQAGIKEVADVAVTDTVTGELVLWFDTLKVSTIETAAETVAA